MGYPRDQDRGQWVRCLHSWGLEVRSPALRKKSPADSAPHAADLVLLKGRLKVLGTCWSASVVSQTAWGPVSKLM